LKLWPALAFGVIQGTLILAHWFIFTTWIAFWPGEIVDPPAGLRVAMLLLAFSFAAATLLAIRFSNAVVRAVYWLASLWLGFVNLFFWTSFLVWTAWFALRLMAPALHSGAVRPILAGVLYGMASLLGLYGLINAQILRIRHVTVELPNLPASWKGRRAVLLSDLHLGPINGRSFCRRIVARAAKFQPDVVFLPGDLFDGTKGDLDRLIAPLKQLAPPLGIYFSTGNHEEFTDPAHYVEAIARAGIRVLGDEMVSIEGVQVAGVYYHSSSSPLRMKAALDRMNLDRTRPAILLNHAPTRLPAVEQAGFSLQLSGHTHGGQFLPFTWITRSVYGRFTSGFERHGSLQVYTSTGAGSWGPPMRLGTQPEMVILTFA
jgi:predicted MPP superfamily phosphohydrolase